MEIKLNVSGQRQLAAQLRRLVGDVERSAPPALAEAYRPAIAKEAPAATGRLKRAVAVRGSDVVVDVPYAGYVVAGAGRHRRRRVPNNFPARGAAAAERSALAAGLRQVESSIRKADLDG